MADSYRVQIDRSGFDLTKYCKAYRHTCDFMGRASDGFTCTVSNPENIRELREQTKPLLQIVFWINNSEQFRGQIDGQKIEDDGSITLTCSDYLSNSVDCSVGKTHAFKQGDTLESVILALMQSQPVERVVSGWNEARNVLAGYQVFSDRPPVDFAKQKLGKNMNIKADAGIWETVDGICRKHHCVAKCGVRKDTIYLVAPEYRSPPIGTLSRIVKEGAVNFRGSVTRDFSKYPTVVVATGVTGEPTEERHATYYALNPDGTQYETDAAGVPINVSSSGTTRLAPKSVIDTFRGLFADSGELEDIQQDANKINVFLGRFDYLKGSKPNGIIYRELRIVDKKAQTKAQLESIARRQLSDCMKRTLAVNFEIDGHGFGDEGKRRLITPDCNISFADEIGDVFEDLWVIGRDHVFQGGRQFTQGTGHRQASIML